MTEPAFNAANLAVKPAASTDEASEATTFYARGPKVICNWHGRGSYLVCSINPGWGCANSLATILANQLTRLGSAPLSSRG